MDVLSRIEKYYPRANLVLAPHEANASDSWSVNARPLSVDQPLRVALIGHLVAHKGREIVEACLKQCAGMPIEFVLVGAAQPPIPADPSGKFIETGVYKDAGLIGLLEEFAPHVIWFPQPVPETYSYTLTTAIDSGLPIVASRIGALSERLEGRPLTWFVDDVSAPASKWLETFEFARQELLATPPSVQTGRRLRSGQYYPDRYLDFTFGPKTAGSSLGNKTSLDRPV